jgi:hypothetical protein
MRRSSCQFDNDKSACKKQSRLLPVDDLAGNNADWLRNHSITISQDRERHYGQKCQSSYRLGSVSAKRCREAANRHIKGHRSGARREGSRPQASEIDPTFCERSPQTSTLSKVTLVWWSLALRRFLSQCERVRLSRPTAYPRRVSHRQFCGTVRSTGTATRTSIRPAFLGRLWMTKRGAASKISADSDGVRHEQFYWPSTNALTRR